MRRLRVASCGLRDAGYELRVDAGYGFTGISG